MTAPPLLPSPVHAGLPVTATCDVCPHLSASHDRIGQRFCDATLAGAVTRGCICRS